MAAATTPVITAVRHARPARLLGDGPLARAVARGDEAALAEMYRRHHTEIFRFCRSMLFDDEDAADALQTTMDRALRSLPGEERPMQLRAWLFRVARNVCIDAIRARVPAAPFDSALDVPSRSAVPEDAETAERLRELLRDLRTLPERQRSALVLRELVGLAHDEIGVVLQTSPAAARQTVYEARVALLELAEGRGTGCEDIRRMLSRGDGRIRRGRRVRAHLGACGGCAAFDAAIGRRRQDFALLAPPLAAPVVFDGLARLAMAKAGGSGGAGLASAVGLPGAVKGFVVVAAAVAVTAGGYTAEPPAGNAPAGSRSQPAAEPPGAPPTGVAPTGAPPTRLRAGARRAAGRTRAGGGRSTEPLRPATAAPPRGAAAAPAAPARDFSRARPAPGADRGGRSPVKPSPAGGRPRTAPLLVAPLEQPRGGRTPPAPTPAPPQTPAPPVVPEPPAAPGAPEMGPDIRGTHPLHP